MLKPQGLLSLIIKAIWKIPFVSSYAWQIQDIESKKNHAAKLRVQFEYVKNNWEARKRFAQKYNEAALRYNESRHWYMKELPEITDI